VPAPDPSAQRAALQRVDALERAKAVLYAQEARSRVNIAQLWSDDPGQVLELAGTARIGQGRAAGQLDRSSRLVENFPLALGLLEHGVMFVATADLLLGLSKNCSPEVQRLLDARLSERVCLMDAADARARITRAIPQLESEVDEAAQRQRYERARQGRRVWVDPVEDGMARIGAELDAVDARRWALDFEELVRAQKVCDEREGVVRTQDQRRADVFAALPSRLLALAESAARGRLEQLLAAARVEQGSQGEWDRDELVRGLLSLPVRKPTVLNVHVGMTTLLDYDQRSGWIEGLGAVPAMRARMLLPTAALRRVGVDERTGVPIGMDPSSMPQPPWDGEMDLSPRHAKHQQSRLLRLLTPLYWTDRAEPQHDPSTAVRQFLQVRDLTCDGPGCPRSASACELDHEQPWVDGGQTAPWNLTHRSTRCHHRKHDDWSVIRDEETGASTWRSPTGSVFERLSRWDPPTQIPDDAVLPEPRLEPPFHTAPDPYLLDEERPLWPTLPPPAPRRTRRGISSEDADDLDDNGVPRDPGSSTYRMRWDEGPPPF